MTALGERGEAMSNQIAGAGTRAVETIDQQLAGLTAHLTHRTDELVRAVAARGVDLAASIANRVDDLSSLINGNGFNLVTALGERGGDVSNQIAGAGTRAAETIDQQMTSLAALMTRRTDELLAAVAARGGDLAASIASRVDDLRSLIDGNGFSLVTALGDRGEVVSNQIAGAGARAVETIDRQMSDLTELLSRRTDELIAAVNGSAADPVRMLTTLSGQLRAEVANRELPDALEALGAIVDDIACYKTVAETEDPTGTGANLLEHGADWVTFASASTVEHFHARFNLPDLLKKFPNMKIASIGPETSKPLAALHVTPAV